MMKSLLTKLMFLLLGITIITGGVVFYYLEQTNKNKIIEQKFQELNTNKIIIQNQLTLLYGTIFYAYANNYDNFQRVIKTTKFKFIQNAKKDNIFKSEGFLIKDGNKVYIIYGDNVSEFFKVKLYSNNINKIEVGNNIYYVSYLKFKPFNLEIIFYDTYNSIKSQVLYKTLKTFEIVIIFIILILFIIFLFVKFIILHPISEVIEHISQISKNKYDYIKENYNTKEFNLVKKYFNQMIDAIQSKEKKIKSYLKDQEKRELFYYDLLNSQENIIIVNDTKKIEHVNNAFFRFFDEYNTLDEFLKEHNCICDYFEKEEGYIYSFKNWIEYLLENQNTQHKVKIIKNNKKYIFNISAKKLQYSNQIIITLNDVTNLETEKEKVLELNTLLEDYKKAIDAGIIVSKTNIKGIITYVNEEFCKISGYTKEELLGKPHNIIRHPDVDSEIFKDLWETIQSGKIWKGEVKNKRKDGTAYYVKTIIAPLMNKDGEIIEYIALREDITDLVYAIQKAKEAEQVKMLFLSNMSHEIRTPLNGILGFTELLLKSKNLPEKEKKYINIIHSSSKALLQIINDVLDISKIESGNLTLEKKEFRPICSFKQAAELFKARAKEKKINYKIDLDFNLTGYIISDEFRIRQVISNLIGNALKFTPENGEVIFSVKQIAKNDKTSTLCFYVKDTGIGIPKDKQKDDLLKYLQKVVNSVGIITDDFTDYDVIISSEYLKEYEDRLILFGDSEKDIISIPKDFDTSDILNAIIDFVDNKENHSKKKDITNLLFNHKILVAEDNEVNQELIKILLDSKGLKYKIANNGLEAVELYKNEKFDLIFMDVNMPEMDGIEATKQIKQYEKANNLAHIPIIALTANSMEGDKDKFLKIMDDYLSKPIMENELNQVLNKYLDAKIEVNNLTETNIVYNKEDIAKKAGIPVVIFTKVLDKFLETIDSYMDDLKKAIENNNLDEIRQHAHKVKGSMMTFYLDYMADILKKMEEDAKNQVNRDYLSDFNKVKKELENFKNSMEG